MKRSMPLVILLVLAVIVSACNSPLLPSFLRGGQGTPTVKSTAPRALPTAKAATGKGATTVSPVATPATGAPAEATIAPVSDLTPAPTQLAGPTVAAEPAATAEGPSAACTNVARMIKDVTIPDNTVVARGQLFVKTWRLQNSGTCPWSTTYAVVFASGEKMGAADATNLPSEVPPGGSVDVSVDLTAPDKAGTFRGNWKMRAANGETFNISPSPDGTFWVQIVVK